MFALGCPRSGQRSRVPVSRFSLCTVFLATVLLSGTAAAAGTPIYEATPAELKSAQQTFAAGNRLYDAGEFAHAITAFRASHDIVASPNSSLMIARCYRELGKLREAVLSFRDALAEANAAVARDKRKYASTLAAIESELAALDPVVGRVSIELVGAAAGTKVAIGDEPIAESMLEEAIPVAPGTIVVTATDPSGTQVTQEVSVEAGQNATVKLTFGPTEDETPPEPEPVTRDEAPPPAAQDTSGLPRTWAYVAGGVGAAGLVTFGVFGVLSNSTFSELGEQCVDDHCAPDKGSDIDRGRSYQTIANIGLVVGLIGVGTGTALYFLSEPAPEQRERARRPRLRLGLASLHVEGRF